MASSAETPRARLLGAKLRHARVARNLTTRQLGDLLGKDSSYVSRRETGKIVATETEVATILGALGVIGDERERLLELARAARDPNWLAPGVGKQLAVLMEYERTADAVTNVQPSLVPGPLQTPDYARSLMISGGATEDSADSAEARRSGRRDVLNRVKYFAIMGEQAVRYPACPPEVAKRQLRQLLEYAEADNITIQVVRQTIGYSHLAEGAFVLIESSTARPVVHLERYRSSTMLTDSRDVRDYQTAAATLRRDAMSPDSTTRLIAKIADEMERKQ
ncbi:helix-turn-helix domain-containing protein [Amycolatopsis nigrescens]|uniref:helix-turn-helix domain-containing protein n=1 Tax=Amycolatopsis nigrescens TaxID=381445 RepID=UPI0004764DFA|nr:helix-turn-helix transcriptional regulator [Amycolatopsis nigrescens]